MLLGVAGHTVVERPAGVFDGGAVGEESLIEALHLTDQVCRVGMTAWRGHEPAVLLGLVATQQQQVVDAEKLQVEQFVLDVLHRRSATDHVGLNGDVIPLLDGGCDGDGARAPAHPDPLKSRLAQTSSSRALVPPLFLNLAIHILRVVGGDIDIGGVEHAQFVDVGKQFVRTCPFQRRQHLERELPGRLILMNQFRYAHNWVQSYKN